MEYADSYFIKKESYKKRTWTILTEIRGITTTPMPQ